ncbi:MAG: hypothetical protein IKP32_03040 [Clostridia bacterium]|nr:hypothetical protein [Clostridia bacterium]
MRKMLLVLAGMILLSLLLAVPALAETYSFGEIRASVEIPNDFEVVLTPYNLSTHAEWIASQGWDFDALGNEFEAEGILLKAYDAENQRTLVITAIKDVDAQTFFDLNNQDEDMRREFRVSHTNGSVYGILGYTYSSAAWRNYGKNVLRFLATKYSLRQEGEPVCTGYQRRTIRNGYTITLDMQIRGRNAKEGDNTVLEKIMKTFQFTEILPMPELPIKLTVSSAPPAETNEETFTVKGISAKKALVTVAVFSLSSSSGQSYNVTAGNNGAFSVKVTLPAQGVYSVTLTAEAEGAIKAQRLYSVTFQKGILPVEIDLSPDQVLEDSTVISGTTIAGAKTQLSISGPISYNKSTTSKTFKFKIDTSAEGTYNFVLTVTKKGLEERRFIYTATRSYSDVERDEKIRSSARKMTYANLSKAENIGKYAVETGYITGISQSINEYVVTLALSKSGNNYKEIVYLISDSDPGFAEGTMVKVYGLANGTYSVLDENGNVRNYPRMTVSFFELAE